ncbi:neuraminidase-like domain-containing protein [Streptomyces albogriseolus]|uniref:Tc toxin subunit A-related protein n=1 Tax=Streptomyces albogriseolus TaxID=1887 RepID=UPI003D753F53
MASMPMIEPDARRIEEVLARHDLAALLHVDFHDPAHRADFLRTTSATDADVDLLKATQRLARIGLLTDPVARASGHLPRRAVARLAARGLTSAHHISELPESVFASEHADAFGGDEGIAREAHRRAVQVRAAVRHATANVRDIASPYFRSIHGNAVDATLADYVESIPGYQELFGSLNYVACDECGSVFGPAAYFFDLLRITERYITKESPGIPPDHDLRERRPDLFELPLTCDNTNLPVPNVLLVNDVIKRRLGQGRVRELARAAYPFNVPYNEPRTQLAGALARLGTPLAEGAAALLAPDPERLMLDSLPLATAALGLSPETVRFLTTPRTTEADIAAEYGLSGLTGHFPAAGPGSITVRAGEKGASGADGRLGEILAVGQQFGLTIAGRSQLRTVTKITAPATVEVDVAWSDSATNSPWTSYPPQDLTTVQMFRDRAGIAAYDDVVALFEQRLSPEEQTTIGGSLWINATSESLPDLRVSTDTGGDEANPIWRIRGLSAKRLDRLSRLLRLSRAVGVPVDILDWLVIQEAPAPADAEITTALLIRLATLRRLADAVRLPLVDVAAFAYRLKTIGRESANTLADPFDRIFNAASVRRGADPYTAPSPIPFDPARPLAWPVGASSDWSANEGRVVAASTTTVTLAHDAASDNGAYVGLTVAITSGPGKGQRAVVQSYDGPSRLATLYTAWPTVPDTSSRYAVAALPGVADRLAAALRLRVVDLHLLGAHVGGRPDAIVLLTLENLTALWRLATLAAWTRLPTEAFLTLTRVLGLSAVPPTPGDGLDQVETIMQVSAWLARTKFSVYELDYVLTGTRSRYLRLNQQPTALPAEVAAIARNGSNTLLTAETLVQAGFTPEDAKRIRAGLQEEGFVDGHGTVLPARERFAAAAARFPVGTSSFARGPIDLAQAQAAVAELREQHPPYLTARDADSSVLTWNYAPGTDLAGLFTGLSGTDDKRAIVAEALAATAQRVTCIELAGLEPVSAREFMTKDIGLAQSQAVYDALLALRPPVLEPATVPGEALLSAGYSAQTPLPGLFESPATGQRATITSYAGADRVATVDSTWTVVPDAFTTYEVRQTTTGEVLTRGNARGGTGDSITLAQSALPDDNAYDGCIVVLIADAEADRKVSQVQATLASTAARIAAVRDVLTQARAAQTGYAAQALTALLAVPLARFGLLLPLATGQFTLDDYLPGLLTPATDGTVPADILALVDRLTRAGLAAGRTGLDDDGLAGVVRRPDHFGLADLDAFTLGSLRLLSAIPTFVGQVGTETSSLISYLDVWTSVVGEDGKRRALSTMAGWEPQQVEITGRFLESAQLGWAGIGAFPGLLRLKVPLAAVDALAADADFLVRVAQAAVLPSLDGGAGDEAIWEEYLTTASAALALLPARFGEEAAPTVADTLTRELAAATRDVLLGYAVVVLGRTLPGVRTVADLFSYLLIDLEMSGCDTTSPIAQGITSVQLYMQRVRLGLETGASAAKIRDTWWEWISTYRLWEANRRVFLYPENYLDPSLRKGASPEFSTLVDELLQGRPTDEHVTRTVANYFDAFENLADLTHVSAYKVEDDVREGGQIDQQSHLVARTNTTPYTYYVRTFTRSLLPDAKKANPASGESIVWGPWQKVEATIDSPDATPVVAFNRLFLFWNEIEPTKSSRVSTSQQGGASTKTESSWTATLHYTYQRSAGSWISSQHLREPMAIRAMPNPAMNDALVTRAYEDTQAYWSRPYAQKIPRGLPATGTLSLEPGKKVTKGTDTVLHRQVTAGDSIWAGGETRQVVRVDEAAQTLEVDQPFRVEGPNTPFKVIPQDLYLTSFRPFPGPGTVEILAGNPGVSGRGTRFDRDFVVGDGIQVGGETRTVEAITGAEHLTVTAPWSVSSTRPGPGLVLITNGGIGVQGKDTRFQTDFKNGYSILLGREQRVVSKVVGDGFLWVEEPFTEASSFYPYTIVGRPECTVIPRTKGDEQLMVFYGPNLDVSEKLPEPEIGWRLENDGGDPFIADLNQINANIFAVLDLAATAKRKLKDVTGDVTGQPTLLLNHALDQQIVRLFAPGVPTTNTTLPARAALDRKNDVLFVRGENRPLLTLYWGNSVPGATQNQTEIGKANDRPLAYHVGGNDSSLYGYGNQIGWYLFNAAGESFWIAGDDIEARTVAPSTFLRPFRQPSDNSDMLVEFGPYTTASNTQLANAMYRFSRLTTSVVPALRARLLAGGFDSLLSLDAQSLPEPPFSQFYQVPSGTPPPAVDTEHLPSTLMDFNGAYGLYFWEVFFHVPMLVAQQFTSNQSFAEAKRWYEYIYHPQAQFADGSDDERRYWRFRPIREGMTLPGLRDILQNQFEVTTYNDDPFDPDAIARLRISAYAKAAVLKYVDNLIAWGDALFRQDTRESVAEATNLYLLASQLLGHRPETVGARPSRPPQSFDEIARNYTDDIPQFLVELENSSLVPLNGEGHRYADAPINDINAYFCVPENAELTAHWDRVEDRLYKIRHCLTIDGVERSPALFAPPIDVRSLAAAHGTAGKGGGVSVLAGGPVPAFRFSQLISSARRLTDDVIRLGSSLLFALENKDVQALASLQATQEGRLLNLISVIRQQQLDLVSRERAAIQAGRDSAAYRSAYYQELIDAGYNAAEIAQIAYLMAGMVSQGASTVVKTASAVSFALPQVGSPFAMTYGGQQVGHTLQESSAALDSFAQFMVIGAEALGLAGQYARRSEDWELQKRLADFDVSEFDARLVANASEQTIAQNELSLTRTQAEQQATVCDFYRTRFTDEALYGWMANRLSTTYFQTYSLALDLARMAQRALQYELATDATFVNAGAWDDLRRGLTAGESLMLSIDQLESAYLTGSRRTFEITKTISLASIDPVAFLQFIRTGEATFSFDEALFDADYPGHFRRRIKTLSVSIPALVGPYQNVRATLTQTANRVLLHPDVDAVRFLLGEDVMVDAKTIEHNVRAQQSITVSLGQGDSGLFQVDFNDPLLLPFEQTGVVSNWRLFMPPSTNPIDLSSIADVIFELKYTALDGGSAFRSEVADLPQLRCRKWSSTVQAARQESSAWHLFMTGPVEQDRQTLSLRLAGLTLPNVTQPQVTGFFLRLVVPDGTTTTSRHPYITLSLGEVQSTAFSPGAGGSVLIAFDTPVPLGAVPLPTGIGFDLAMGRTPEALRENGRVSSTVLQDIELVLFLAGDV